LARPQRYRISAARPGNSTYEVHVSSRRMGLLLTIRSTTTPTRSDVGAFSWGLLGVGRKHTPAVTKALSIFYQEVQKARELIVSDPAAAARIYGTAGLTKQETDHLLFLYELALTYVLTRKGSDQVAEAIESRVRRELQDNVPSARRVTPRDVQRRSGCLAHDHGDG